jgi:hypothetical protein
MAVALAWIALAYGETPSTLEFLCSSHSDDYGVPKGYDCALVDADGHLVTRRLFQEVRYQLRESRFVFALDGQVGYADLSGTTVFRPVKGLRGRPFYENRAAVCSSMTEDEPDICGFIDSAGRWVIRLAPNEVSGDFHEGRAWVMRNGRLIYYIDPEGRRLFDGLNPVDFSSGRVPGEVMIDGKKRGVYVDRDGKPLLKLGEGDPPRPFFGRYAYAARGDYRTESDVTGLLDADGGFTPMFKRQGRIPPPSFRLGPENNGYLLIDGFSTGRSRWAIIGPGPSLTFGPILHGTMHPADDAPHEGVLPVWLPRSATTNADTYDHASTKIRYIKPDGTTAIDAEFSNARGFSEDLAAASPMVAEEELRKGQKLKWGFIDHSGRWAIEPAFDGLIRDFRLGRAIVLRGGSEILIDQQGRVVADYATIRRSLPVDGDDGGVPWPAIDACTLENEIYLAQIDRIDSYHALGGPWNIVCNSEGLRRLLRQVRVQQHRALAAAPGHVDAMWSSIQELGSRLQDRCKAEPECLRRALQDELSDRRWAIASPAQSAVKPPVQKVALAVRTRLTRLIRNSELYNDDPGNPQAISFGSFDFGRGVHGVLATQYFDRSSAFWLFVRNGNGERLVLSGSGGLLPMSSRANGYPELDVSEGGNYANDTFYRYDGKNYRPFLTCRIGYTSESGQDDLRLAFGCETPQH